MPFVAIPGGVRLAVVGTHLGNQIVNVFHYFAGSEPLDSGEIEDFVEAWSTNHVTEYLAIKSQDYTLTSITGTDISVAGGATFVKPFPATAIGTSSPASAPGNVAGVISWRTGAAGRTNRGRSYIGPLPSNGFSGDTMDSDVLPFMTALAESLIAGGPGEAGFDFGVASYKDLAIKIVTSFVIDVILDSMRRRLTGRGA